MSRLKFFMLLLALSSIMCCGNSGEAVKASLAANGVVLENYSKVVVIPYHGCSTCVNNALVYLKRNAGRKDQKFVFTNYTSKKEILIRLRLSDDLSEDIVFIEDARNLIQSGVSHFYPSVVTFNSGETEVEVSDPNNLSLLQ